MTEDDGALARLWNDITTRVESHRQPMLGIETMLRCLIPYASEWFAHRRGSQNGWTYAATQDLKHKLCELLLAKLENKDHVESLRTFRAVMYQLHARSVEPFPGCAKICTQPDAVCLYRNAVADLIMDIADDLRGDWNQAYLKDVKGGQGLQNTWAISQRASYGLIDSHPVQFDAIRRIRLCYAQHMLSRHFVEDHLAILKDLLAEADKPGDGGLENE